MAQVLKAEVKNKILVAAEQVFYEKDYISAKLTEIANKANVPVALIYTYFKNKEALFDAIVEPVYSNFSSAIEKEEESKLNTPSECFDEAGKKYVYELLKIRQKLIILIDKSAGTKHTNAKQKLISQIQKHIATGIKKDYDPMLSRILASNFTEGLLEIARHYKDEEWAKTIFKLLAQCYYKGVDSL